MTELIRFRMPVAELRRVTLDVRRFATEEAKQSGLPGVDQGPADAYRHLVGVAELARRIGRRPADAIEEANETRNWLYAQDTLREGRSGSDGPAQAARAMDRHNNRIALAIGANAASPEEVVQRVREVMDQAIRTTGGSGHNGTPFWQAPQHWSGGAANWVPQDWSAERWPDLAGATHFDAYRATLPARPGNGDVTVRPHTRNGQPVSGHSRSAPAP